MAYKRKKSSAKKFYVLIWSILSLALTMVYYFSSAQAESADMEIVTVNTDLPPGTTINERYVKMAKVKVPNEEVNLVLTDISKVIGKQTVFGIHKGRPVLKSDLIEVGEETVEITVPVLAENLGDPSRMKVANVWVRSTNRDSKQSTEQVAEKIVVLDVFNRNNVSVFKEGVTDVVPNFATISCKPEQVGPIVDSLKNGSLFFVNPYPQETIEGVKK